MVVIYMKSCRIQALIEELLMDWDKLNLAAKLLVYIGFFLIFATVFISIYKSQNQQFAFHIFSIRQLCVFVFLS